MNNTIQADISFDQILTMVKKLPNREKVKLSEELEKEVVESKLTKLLKTFRTKDLSLQTLNEEVEFVRQKIYDIQKH